ncbi:hypothetical protein Xmau_01159 [Xenorhabdus mauleonii]|uniref:Type VI secretion system protein ImpA n=1 Tax=Xenorhabdus mauleonii TaxID=351675 RepID=A0A1I3MHA7_9GAMM|nr:type VI secretion system protein TssA [Xenorhabdus mauleonii]PHM45507.1 hypothetical protein Xmau_01159 [Xenorhabdus mauleonii]SFI96076.1 type VI secretion system protein ImpA [Xenorhabdus mauleonii]
MNIDELLTPISPESPCGDDLEYDDEFLAIERLLVEKPEQQFGDVIIPAEPPNWGQIEKKATKLLTRTKDLRIIIALMRSWLNQRGLGGYADGLNLLRQTLERYWVDVWPKLEFDGEYDPLLRLNTLAAIEDGSPSTITAQYSLLLKDVSSELTFQEAYSLLSGTVTEVSNYSGGRSRLVEELQQKHDSPEIQSIKAVHEHLTALLEIIRDNLSAGHMPVLPQFMKQLETIIEYSSPPEEIDIAGDSDELGMAELQSLMQPGTDLEQAASSIMSGGVPLSLWKALEVSNRDEAHMLLEKVKNYFLQHEPSHPAPMMIQRVQRLIHSDFMDIIHDLAPSGLDQLEVIFGHASHSDTDMD